LTKNNPFAIVVGLVALAIFVIIQLVTHYWYVFLISLPIVYYLYKKHQDAEARQKLIKEQQQILTKLQKGKNEPLRGELN
jgi:1,4-dihydroxy-2-naphthoate octaprenyltransferase